MNIVNFKLPSIKEEFIIVFALRFTWVELGIHDTWEKIVQGNAVSFVKNLFSELFRRLGDSEHIFFAICVFEGQVKKICVDRF